MDAFAWLGAVSPKILDVVPLDTDRAVVKLDLFGVQFGTIFVVGMADGFPRVSWPRTSRGYPIFKIGDPLARDLIEEVILNAVAAATEKAAE